MGSAIQNGADGLFSSGVPRAELPPFELTPPPVSVRSRSDFSSLKWSGGSVACCLG